MGGWCRWALVSLDGVAPAGCSVCLPLLISPCTIKSRSSLLATAHPGGPGKRAVKRLWCGGYEIGQAIIFLPCGFFLSSSFFFPSPNLSGRRLDVYHTSTHGVALVQIQNAGLKCAVRGSLEMQVQKNCHLGTIAQLCRAISSQLRHILTIGKKNLLNSNISPTCPYNMVNFGPLVAEIGSLVWRTPANFNGFRVLAALLHGTLVVGISQTLRC